MLTFMRSNRMAQHNKPFSNFFNNLKAKKKGLSKKENTGLTGNELGEITEQMYAGQCNNFFIKR